MDSPSCWKAFIHCTMLAKQRDRRVGEGFAVHPPLLTVQENLKPPREELNCSLIQGCSNTPVAIFWAQLEPSVPVYGL